MSIEVKAGRDAPDRVVGEWELRNGWAWFHRCGALKPIAWERDAQPPRRCYACDEKKGDAP